MFYFLLIDVQYKSGIEGFEKSVLNRDDYLFLPKGELYPLSRNVTKERKSDSELDKNLLGAEDFDEKISQSIDVNRTIPDTRSAK